MAVDELALDLSFRDVVESASPVEVLQGLERHFALPPVSGRRLIALAEEERQRSIDHFQFTGALQRGYDLGQKMVLAEVMWGLVLADGKIAEHEHYITRKIANLLDLEPGSLAAAKAAAARAAP